MYVPSIHSSRNEQEAFDYIKSNGFATLIGNYKKGLIATHIPMYLDETKEGNKLLSHVALSNEQKNCFDGQQEMLAIFMNTHAYISSSWYDHINVPTWNYVSVHVYGKAKILEGEELHNSILKIVDQYENGRKARFHLEDMSDKMQKAHFNGLVGFEMSMDRIESAHKLSQNRHDKDYRNIIDRLEKGDEQSSAIAQEMKKLRS